MSFSTVPGAQPGQQKAIATPLRWHGPQGGDADGHQIDDCSHCGRGIERWLRPRRSDQHRGWWHEWSQSEYCYAGVFIDER